MIFKNLFRRNRPEPTSPLLLIVGLGNPGTEYENTRHNAGFLALDTLREQFGFEEFKEDKKYKALVTFGKQGSQKIILVKPLTFMNASGESVRSILDFYKIPPRSLIVIHDEVDLPSGSLRSTGSSRAAGHNGVQNIIDSLGTQDFSRIRLGIGRPVPQENGTCMAIHDYVLQKFSPGEKETLESLFPEVKALVEKHLNEKPAL